MLFSRPILVLLSLAFAGHGFAQLKDRDYTLKSGSQFKRYQGGTKLFSSTLNTRISAKRIHVSEIPFHFSRFGGKRFPVNQVDVLQRRQFPAPTLNYSTIHQSSRADANGKFALQGAPRMQGTSVLAEEFRDKHDESLDKRVDEWMEKVNNLSLADINRYQFRRGRSTKPGFPVQKAGESSSVPSKKLLPSVLQSSSTSPNGSSSTPSRYWLGPKKASASRGNERKQVQPSSSRVSPRSPVSFPKDSSRITSPSRIPKIRLGPPKITIRTK